MAAELIRDVLGWCSLINVSIFLLWVGVFVWGHDMIYGVHKRWFSLSTEKFDALQYGAMAFCELVIIVFNLVPYLVLRELVP